MNAFFVAAEMGLARVRRTRIDHLAEGGNMFAKKTQIYLEDPEKFISACQLGITIATLLLGAAGEAALAENIAEHAKHFGEQAAWGHKTIESLRWFSYAAAFTFTAYVQTVGGELLPKMLTYTRAETVILWTVLPMHFWCILTSPFLKILNGTTAIIVALLKIKEPPSAHTVHSEEELKMLVSASHEEGVLESEQEEMLHSVFDFADTTASEVMTPRIDMVCVPAEATVKAFVTEALKHGHSRLPVYDEDVDNIFGVVHIRDGLRALIEHKENAHVREFARKVLIVPENKNLKDLLTEFKRTKTHMAVVMNEYGGTQGIVTL
ncbi:MAG TPA: hemolysin family protein, partial [Candidatus Obscuribacter sp.]|nr:hemolysin family protein [Candidatus Obscuribacter sp.]